MPLLRLMMKERIIYGEDVKLKGKEAEIQPGLEPGSSKLQSDALTTSYWISGIGAEIDMVPYLTLQSKA